MLPATTTDESDGSGEDGSSHNTYATEVQRILRDLRSLQRSYYDQASKLSDQHISVYIEEIAKLWSPLSPEFQRNLQIRFLAHSMFNFVLDQFQDPARLNELNNENLTPARIATDWLARDLLAILLARGAKPYSSPEETLYEALLGSTRKRFASAEEAFQLKGLLVLRNLTKLWHGSDEPRQEIGCISLAWRVDSWPGIQYRSVDVGIGTMLYAGPWEPGNLSATFPQMRIHIPFTNIPLLLDIFRIIDGYFGCSEVKVDRVPVLNLVYSSLRRPVITPGNPLLNYRDSMYRQLTTDGRYVGIAMVFPFLVLERLSRVRRVRAIYDPVRDSQPWKYGMEDHNLLAVCLDRTLDEAYFPSMDDAFFRIRNQDQVVTKEWRRTAEEIDPDSAPVIVVPQLWLWTFGSALITAYSSRRTSSKIPVFYSNGQEERIRLFGQAGKVSIELEAGIIIASLVSEFGEEHDREHEGSKFKSTLHMFETAVIAALSSVQQYLDEGPRFHTIKQQKKKEQMFIHTMADIHGELDMISSVLEQQKRIMNKFLRETKGQQENAVGEEEKGWEIVKSARAMLNDYTDRVEKIHRDADRVDKTIESYLNLKRTYASIEDTRNSLMVGFAATAFAFVTVIFTPLSFMTSLFALPVDHFARQQYKEADSEDGVFKSSYIAGYTALAGIATWIVTIALLVGLYYYWKISSRPEKEEKNVDGNDAKTTSMESTRGTKDSRNKKEESPKSVRLRAEKLWRRKTPKEQASSV